MANLDPIAYTYEADVHCEDCALARFGAKFRSGSGNHIAYYDTYQEAKASGLPFYGPFIGETEKDSEGNGIGVVFSWDEYDLPYTCCGTCQETLCLSCGTTSPRTKKGEEFPSECWNCHTVFVTEAQQAHDRIEKEYAGSIEVDRDGFERITGPGKFSSLFMAYLFELWGDGSYAQETGGDASGETSSLNPWAFFLVDEDEQAAFGGIADTYGASLEEDSQGFVYLSLYDTEAEYDKALADVQADEEADAQARDEEEERDRALGEAYDELEKALAEDVGRCGSCEAAMINGVRSHETGCPVERRIENLRAKVRDLEE